MSYTRIKKLPSSEDIIQAIPVSPSAVNQIEKHREEIENILSGKDNRLLIVVGPCSAWPNAAVLEYAKRLKQLNEKIKDKIKVVMRVYIQKPRTTIGWTGPVNQPDPCKDPDIELGVKYVRQMMVDVVEMGLPISDEALFTHNAKGFIDLLSWVAIGARSSEDQEHRIFASSIDCPVGLKNPTHGSLVTAMNSIVAAQYPHNAVLDGYEIQTHGNAFAHLVLRGSQQGPNYSNEHLEKVKSEIDKRQIKNPAIMIDVSHDNCLKDGKKDASLQPTIVKTVLDDIKNKPELKKLVKGFMLESFLKAGNQKVDPSQPESIDRDGLSITDPCLAWGETESLLLDLAEAY